MKTEAIRLCIQAQYGKEDYDEARKELNALLARLAELEAAQHGVEPTDLPRAYLASELSNEQIEYLLTLGGSR